MLGRHNVTVRADNLVFDGYLVGAWGDRFFRQVLRIASTRVAAADRRMSGHSLLTNNCKWVLMFLIREMVAAVRKRTLQCAAAS